RSSKPSLPQRASQEEEQTKGRILIVDDSEISRQVVRLTLEAAGYEVLDLESARDATRVILRRVPDLVLMDVVMPDLAGDKAVEIIRARSALRHTRVVLFSERPAEELESLAKSCGADGYIQKTSKEADLVSDVAHWIARATQC
ncbi:MAG: response regulator, partial [Myxococcota bacterium]